MNGATKDYQCEDFVILMFKIIDQVRIWNPDTAATSAFSMYYKITDSEWRNATKSDAHLVMRTGSSSISSGT
jgi:hypothetical protein